MNGKHFVLFLFVGFAATQVSSLNLPLLGGSSSTGISPSLDALLKTVKNLIVEIQNEITAILNSTVEDIEAVIFDMIKTLVGDSLKSSQKCLDDVQGDVTNIASKILVDLQVCANNELVQLQKIKNDVKKVSEVALKVSFQAETNVVICLRTLNLFCLLDLINDVTTASQDAIVQLATLSKKSDDVSTQLTSCTSKIWADATGTIQSLGNDVIKCANSVSHIIV